MGRKKEEIKKEDISEGCCFVCKDGGDLRLCDYRFCLKVYHPECVGKDNSFLESADRWTCRWHTCSCCQKAAKFHCFCCPNAVCKRCLNTSGFVILKRNQGFCSHCLKLAQLVEENKDVDCDGVKIDFEDQDTYEYLFKMYWIVVKEKEELTLEHIHVAANLSRKARNYECENEDDYVSYSDNESPSSVSDSDDLSYMGDDKMPGTRNRSQKKSDFVKDKVNKKKTEFIGWASKSLVEFLTSIGREVTSKLSQYEVTSIITRYCEERKLFRKDKKKMILCDVRLQSLLRKKSINKNKLYSALECHFAENWEESEDDEDTSSSSSSNCTDGNGSAACKRQKSLTLDRGFQIDVRSSERLHLFASIIPQNIKLVYLNRSLVQELLLYPEHFESKVVGCFVRVKSDPNDFMQKNSHQLLLVTGVKRSSTIRGSGTGIFLQVPYMVYDIDICKLSDDDFSEEECDDLRQRMNTGLLRRPTVLELEQKAKTLHVDKTKHWIQRELVRLQRLIDRANEKGWRRELFKFQQYWERRNLLQTPAEQSHLLDRIPEVVAEAEELQSAVHEKENHVFPESIHRMGCLTPTVERKDSGYLPQVENEDAAEERCKTVGSIFKKTRNAIEGSSCQEAVGDVKGDEIGQKDVHKSTFDMKQNQTELPQPEKLFSGCITKMHGQPKAHNQPKFVHLTDDDTSEVRPEQSKSKIPNKHPNEPDFERVKTKGWSAGVELIDISDDEDSKVSVNEKAPENPDCDIWYLTRPGCGIRGPFSLSLLKNWIESRASNFKFKVWKEGQSQEDAILLTDAIQLFYPRN